MTESSAPDWPGSQELQDIVNRAVSERLDPMVVQLAALTRGLAILAERMPDKVAEPGVELSRVVEKVQALDAAISRDAEARRTQTGELRQMAATAVAHSIAKIEQARKVEVELLLDRITALATDLEQGLVWVEAAVTTDSTRILDEVAALGTPLDHDAESQQGQTDELRAAMAAILERSLGQIEEARTADAALLERLLAKLEAERTSDASRLLEQVATLEGLLTRDAIARQAQLDDLRHTVAATIGQAVHRIEATRTADVVAIASQVDALAAKAEADARRGDEQAAALLAAVDERLHTLHVAGTDANAAAEERLAARLDAVTVEHRQVLLERIDERTTAIADLEAITPRLAAEVRDATTLALTRHVEPLVTRLVEAIDTLAHEGGRIEALARGHAGEARAVEERVATMFAEVAERAESAVDRSRGRIAEGQVALNNRLDAIIADLLVAITAATDRLEARVAGTAEGLRVAGGHQNGALLDAVNRSAQQLAEGLADVRTTLLATASGSDAVRAEAGQRADALAEHLDSLRVVVESIRHDPRIDALVVEQVAAREAQMTAIEAISGRVDQVGPLVARALLPEVERATRAANATEEAVASLRPDDLRAAVVEAAGQAADDVRAAAERLDRTIAAIAEQVEQGLGALAEGQAGLASEVAGQRPPDGPTVASRIDELDEDLRTGLASLAAAVDASRDELLTLTSRALERSAVAADDAAQASGTAIDDLRAAQDTLREAVQEGAHKAELAALDIRGLRERLAPHLVALADATTRRAEADQAGFDAILARLDQLLTTRQR